MEGKNVIYFYRDWWDFLEDFTIEQRGEWITYVMMYVNDLEPNLPRDKQVMSVCKITQNQLKRDLNDWLKSIEKKSEAGKKGMASRWGSKNNNTNDNNDNIVITSDNTVITGDNDKDKVKDKEKDKDKVKVIDKDINYLSNDNDGLNDFEYKMFLEDLESKIGYEPNPYDKEKIKSWVIKGYDLNGILKEVDRLLEKKVDNHSIINYINKSFSNVENGTINQNKPIQVEEDIEEEKTTGSDWLDNYKKPVYSGSSKKVELIKPKNTEEEDVRKLQELQMKLEAVIGKDLIKTESDMLKKEYKKYSADSIIAETRNAILFGENKVDPVVEALKMLKKKSMEVNRI